VFLVLLQESQNINYKIEDKKSELSAKTLLNPVKYFIAARSERKIMQIKNRIYKQVWHYF
jgi:hypothetical protein